MPEAKQLDFIVYNSCHGTNKQLLPVLALPLKEVESGYWVYTMKYTHTAEASHKTSTDSYIASVFLYQSQMVSSQGDQDYSKSGGQDNLIMYLTVTLVK